jgi:hypothetical protein
MDVANFLQSLFSSGRVVDIALAFMGLEFLYLLWATSPARRGAVAINLMLALGPGACLLLALRCALTQAGFIWVAFWLVLSLPLHLADIVCRRP